MYVDEMSDEDDEVDEAISIQKEKATRGWPCPR